MLISEKHKTIIQLLSDGEFHSGNAIASALNISRVSVWQYLHRLTDIGLHFSAVNGKGYRLDKPLELLNRDKILPFLNKEPLGLINNLEIHDCIDSTNNRLNLLATAGAASGTVCFAEQQTAGKGRRGRHWVSPFGHNIYLSILWRFQTSPSSISGLSLAVGVAVIRALNFVYPHVFSLKWPNDIYFQNKKLGGILVEVSGESEGPCAATVGLGLNMYLPATEAKSIVQEWTDLSQILQGSQSLSRNTLAGALLNELLPVLAGFQECGITPYLDEWRQYDCLKDKPATLYIGQRSYEGIVKGIDNQGLLVLTREDGMTQSFASGEVSLSKPQ